MSQNGPRGLPDATDPVDRALCRFALLLRESPHNLLSPRGLEELESRHFPESVAFAATLPTGADVLDIGSGGGLPGVVLAVARPDVTVQLLEATGKKAEFLRKVATDLGLDMEVHHGRAEDLCAGPLSRAFDVVTARAVAPLDRLVLWAEPFLRPGGSLHAIKGDRWRTELEEARGNIGRLGLEVVSTPDDSVGSVPEDGPKVVVLRHSN